jgi:hypothetical protein
MGGMRLLAKKNNAMNIPPIAVSYVKCRFILILIPHSPYYFEVIEEDDVPEDIVELLKFNGTAFEKS